MRHLLLWLLLLLPALVLAEPLRLFVSVLPLKTIVEKVGGEHVEVGALAHPGYNPHTYNPTPQQIAALSGAALYIRAGFPFEHAWMDRIRSANPGMKVQDVREGIDLHEIGEHEQDCHEDQINDPDRILPSEKSGRSKRQKEARETDPHIWTSPPLAKQMAGTIRDRLAELDPAHAEDYRRNFEVFAIELDALDRSIRLLLKGAQGAKFMVFHPAWGYFADHFDLIQVPIEKEGKEPGPRALTALIDQATREKVKVIFVQPQFSMKSAKQVARAIGGRVLAVDPLSSDYPDNLRTLAEQIAKSVAK